MKLEVYSIDGKKNGKSVELDATVFGIKPNRTVMFEDVRRIHANKRQGTAKTKSVVKFAVLRRSYLSKKVLVMHVVVILNLHCYVEVVQRMVQDHVRTTLA